MNIVSQAQDITNYIEALEFENNRLRNTLFRILESGDISFYRIPYEPLDTLDFTYATTSDIIIIKKIDCSVLGITSPQEKITKLKSKI
jgi:hypothetical protein